MKPNIKLSLAKLLSLKEYELSSKIPPTIIVDCESMEVIQEIEKDLEVFKSMNDECQTMATDDVQKMLLINARRDERFADEISHSWFWFSSLQIRDYHELFITNTSDFCFRITNKLYVSQNSSEIVLRQNLVEPLKHFRECILETINWILTDNGQEYKYWITHFMPKELRTGVISRQKYNSIIGRDEKVRNMESLVCEIISRARPIKFQRMTLGIYIQYWCMCYRLLFGKKAYKKWSDTKLFSQYNNTGRYIESYDLDCEADFRKWQHDMMGGHAYDLLYAKISLLPFQNFEGSWSLRFSFDEFHWEKALEVIIGLDKRHIHLSTYQDMLPRLREQDYLMVSKYSSSTEFYHRQLDKGIVIGRPNVDLECEEPENIRAIIKATKWLEEPCPQIAGHAEEAPESETSS